MKIHYLRTGHYFECEKKKKLFSVVKTFFLSDQVNFQDKVKHFVLAILKTPHDYMTIIYRVLNFLPTK